MDMHDNGPLWHRAGRFPMVQHLQRPNALTMLRHPALWRRAPGPERQRPHNSAPKSDLNPVLHAGLLGHQMVLAMFFAQRRRAERTGLPPWSCTDDLSRNAPEGRDI